MKKLFAAALALIALLCASALCEEEIYFASEEGGVIERESAFYRTRALIQELNVAYMDSDTAYLAKGVQTKFTVYATGGDGIYNYSISVYWREGKEGAFYMEASSGTMRSNSYIFTPKKNNGQYLLLVRIVDSAGSAIQWQSQVYESAGQASVQKVRSLANECVQKASTDYARALWLHDWLIMNADYDYNYEYYYPDGVLLHGTGVCQSYALAYDMLLKMIGIETVYITGYAGGGDHGWNLVKLDGEWYHVDCTWDDPSPGSENHDYFCVPDDIMMRDHSWNLGAQIMPQCEKNDYMYAIRSGAETCETQEDVIAILNESLLAARSYTEIWYMGANPVFDFTSAVNTWYDQAHFPQEFLGFRYTTGSTNLKMEFDFGSGFPDLTVPESMKIDLTDADMEVGEEMRLLVLPLPSSADVSALTWSSSNPDCIQVDGGYVKAIASGVSVITAEHPGGAASEIILYVNSGRMLTMPAFLSSIGEEAFADNALIETVILQNGIDSIGDRAFMDCAMLKTIEIPESVTYIGNDVFSGCERVVISCKYGSAAHEYAENAGIEYRLMSTEP